MWWDGPFGHVGVWGGLAALLIGLFWIAVIVCVVLLVRYLVSRREPSAPQDSAAWGRPGDSAPPVAPKTDALRVVEERYARGEIDREEFLQKKADLTS
ncbi:MAG: hypothetical protein BWY79_01989 [Actinobacteria bacterium ADurb.Bin444]|nr:MAG: hypothetical protein BWY79_01989 [Actinobacteria bacterium ADurb.Bin444]